MFPIICSCTHVERRSPHPILLCTAFGSFFLAGEQEPRGSDGCSEASSFPRGDRGSYISFVTLSLALHECRGREEEREGKEYTVATSVVYAVACVKHKTQQWWRLL